MIKGNLALKLTEDERRAARELRPFLVRRFEVRPANDHVTNVVIAFPRCGDPAPENGAQVACWPSCTGGCTVCTGSYTCDISCTSSCTTCTDCTHGCTGSCTSCTSWCTSCTIGWTGKADLTPQ